MQWSEYQSKAAKTAIYPDPFSKNVLSVMYCALGLAGEAGEVAGKVKKIYRDDDGKLTSARKAQIEKEIGDTFWYLAQLMNELDIDGNVVLADNLTKLQARKATGTLCGDGDNREAQAALRVTNIAMQTLINSIPAVVGEHYLQIEDGRPTVWHVSCAAQDARCLFVELVQKSLSLNSDYFYSARSGLGGIGSNERFKLSVGVDGGLVLRTVSELLALDFSTARKTVFD